MKVKSATLKLMLIITLVVVNISIVWPQSDKLSAGDDSHELTVYVFPTLKPLDWTSPASLYKSTIDLYLKTMFLTDHYLL